MNGKRKTNEEFVKEVFDLVGSEYEFLESYINNKTKIKCKHNKCGHEWSIVPGSFLRGTRCPECAKKTLSKKYTKSNEKFIQEVYELVGNEYTFLEDYINDKTKIKCKHNLCGHEWDIVPSSFLRGRGCPECKGKRISETKTWDDAKFKEEVCKVVGDEYTFLEEYVNSRTKIKVRHNECGYEYEVTPNHFFNGTRCPNHIIRTERDFLERVQQLVGDEYTFIGEYIDTATKIKCKHNECGYEWEIKPNNFLSGQRCPECAMMQNGINSRMTNDEFIQRVYNLVGDEYTFLGEYVIAKSKLKVRHNKCDYTYDVAPYNFLSGRRCPQCAESKGEQVVRRCLENNDICFLQEYEFDDLLSEKGNPLRFDFAVFNTKGKLIFLIEYDGEFHYQDIYKDGSLEIQQVHDERKNQYCKDNNIPLLRIPYWEFDNIEDILEEWLINYGLLQKDSHEVA